MIDGFEREKCIAQNADAINLSLVWTGQETRSLAGRNVRLRFYARAARIYAVTESAN